MRTFSLLTCLFILATHVDARAQSAARFDAMDDLVISEGDKCFPDPNGNPPPDSKKVQLRNLNQLKRVIATVSINSLGVQSFRYLSYDGIETEFRYPIIREVRLLPGESEIIGCSKAWVSQMKVEEPSYTLLKYVVSGAYYPNDDVTWPLPPDDPALFVGFIYRSFSTGFSCPDGQSGLGVRVANWHPRRNIYTWVKSPVWESAPTIAPQTSTSVIGCQYANSELIGWHMVEVKFK